MKIKFIIIGIIISVFCGCAYQQVAIKKGYDFSKIKRVAVVGFSGYSNFRNSGDVVADEFIMQLINKGFSVIERSRIDVLMRERQIRQMDSETAKDIGKILGVDVIITGSVIKYVEDNKSTVYNTDSDGRMTSQITMSEARSEITARMIDVQSGEIVWTSRNQDVAFDIADAVSYTVSGLLSTLKW